MPLARVTVYPIDSDENVGICAGCFDVPCDDDNFVPDRNQVANFACKALNRLVALKSLELVFFGC